MHKKYIYVKLSASHFEQARDAARLKEERGKLCGIRKFHKPLTYANEAFFTGSVGEIVVAEFIRDSNDSGLQVICPDDPAIREVADIIAGGHHIDVKTRAARYHWMEGYRVFVEKKSAEHDTDYFVFVWYNRKALDATILGFLEKDDLLNSRLFLRGETIDNGWRIPCDSYGIRICDLEDIDILPALLRENGNVRGIALEKAAV